MTRVSGGFELPEVGTERVKTRHVAVDGSLKYETKPAAQCGEK